MPPTGNGVAAQLLGFKLRFYASDARDASDVLPENLIYLGALLIKIGFISILDLYPHLYPADEQMSAHREKLQQEKKERDDKRRGKTTNALAMAGALPDDTLPPVVINRVREMEKSTSKSESRASTPKVDEESKETLPEPVDQKAALLRSLLCIGAIPEALFILGRFPWLLEFYPDLQTYMCRLAHHSLSKMYDLARPVPLGRIPVVSKGADDVLQRPANFTPRRPLRWAKAEQKDAGDGVDYRFYWEDWTDNVPICQTVDDVFLLCSSFLGLLGPECGRDIVLMTKLARIGKFSVTQDPSPENLKRWSDLSATLLAPALTFTGQNPGVINEIWELFKRFDTATRYSIYTLWFNSSKPAMRAAFKEVQDDTRNILGKVASTNTRPMGRAMAKLAYACPGTVFQQTLRQGQGYINMIDALVECSRYLTHLGYDCLTWTLINSLVTNDRPTLQGDGMLVKGWLKNTSIFIGKVYRRYSLMDPTPILQFAQHQIVRPEGELYMLSVLEQLITSMGGINFSGALTEARVLALSAGPALRAYTLETHLGDKRHATKTPTRRLLRCLKDSGLSAQLLIALAQQVENYLFREELEDVPDKVVLTNYDNLRSSFHQYFDFLRDNSSTNEFDDIVPSVVELMAEYGLDTGLAFHICRQGLAESINAARIRELNQLEEMVEGRDTDMAEADAATSINGTTAASHTVVNNTEADALDVAMKEEGTEKADTISFPTRSSASWQNPRIDSLAEQMRLKLPAYHQCIHILPFFATFWTLTQRDIYPTDGNGFKKQYQDAKDHIKSKTNPTATDRISTRQATADIKKLSEEYDALMGAAQAIQVQLQKESQLWFNGVPVFGEESTAFHDLLIQECFLPRLRISLQDAQFASSMLFYMHKTAVPGFRILKSLDRLFNANTLACLITMMSEDETKCFGRFLNDILKELQRWHEDKDVYQKAALGEKSDLPGFGMIFNADGTPSVLLTYDQFRNIHFKWHKDLSIALKNCLTSGQYMELRNTINILKTVSSAFPKVEGQAKDLRQVIETYAQEDERDDVKVAANSLLYEFHRNAKHLKSESLFRTVSLKPLTLTIETKLMKF